jgi:DNA-binding transcriptional LysR family regulator
MDLGLLSLFVEVADASSFSRAARKLGTTTATVSRGIAKLEELLRTELVHRTTRSVSLSTAGAALYERAAPHVRALRGAATELPERQEEPAGTLRITAPYDFGVTLLGELIARFSTRYPKVRIEADFTTRQVDLVAEGFDLAIRGGAGKQRDSSLTVRRLVNVGMLYFYASPTYVARRGSPRSVGSPDHEWLIAAPMRRLLDLPQGFEARVVANDFLFLREAARAGAGVAVLPAFIAEPHVAAGALVRVLPSGAVRAGGLVLLYPSSGHPARKVVAFRDFLVETIKKEWFG